MVNTTELISELEEQEKRGFFKSLRKRQIAKKKWKADQMTVLKNVPFHIQNAIKLTGEFKALERHERIHVCGTGINAIAGDMLKTHLSGSNLDIRVERDYEFETDNKSLVFIVSYTGDDEQAIMCYKTALRKGAKIIGITSGGRLLEAFKRNNTEHVALVPKLVESTTLYYLFFPILKVLDNSKLIQSQGNLIEEALKALKKPELKDMAKQLYEKMQDRIPVIYSSAVLEPVARHWKLQFNLNAKIPAFNQRITDAISELNSYVKDMWDVYVVFLSDQEDIKEVRKAMNVAKTIIKNRSYGTTELNVKGTNQLARLLTAAYIGEYASYYLNEYYKLEEDLLKKFREEYKKA